MQVDSDSFGLIKRNYDSNYYFYKIDSDILETIEFKLLNALIDKESQNEQDYDSTTNRKTILVNQYLYTGEHIIVT